MLTSFHGHTKIIIIYRVTIDENDLKMSRKDFLQQKVYRRNHNEMGRRDRGTIRSR